MKDIVKITSVHNTHNSWAASRTGSEAYGVVAEAAVAAGRSRPHARRCLRMTGASSPLAVAAGNPVPLLRRRPQDPGE